VLAANAAARRRFDRPQGRALAQVLGPVLPQAAAILQRQEDALQKRAAAHETVQGPRGPLRIAAHRVSGGAFWRIDDDPRRCRAGEGIGLPMMVVSQSDTILSMNAAMRELLGRRATGLDEVFPDQPVVPGRRTR
jgi:two-component system cell cycle sensor histidine kinase/response regulator CckA